MSHSDLGTSKFKKINAFPLFQLFWHLFSHQLSTPPHQLRTTQQMFAEWFYRRLITSPRFHYYVRIIHATINNLPPPPPPPGMRPTFGARRDANIGVGGFGVGMGSTGRRIGFRPTVRQRLYAYVSIWKQEMTDTFLFRK